MLVEGVGGQAAPVLIGFDADVLSRAGLGTAIADPVLQIAAGISQTGVNSHTGYHWATLKLADLDGQVLTLLSLDILLLVILAMNRPARSFKTANRPACNLQL